LVVTFLCLSTVAGQDPPPHQRLAYWSVQAENDLWGSGADRHYTHGTKFSLVPAGEAPDWLKRLGGYVPFFRPGYDRGIEFSIGQNIYTPDDIEDPNLIADDRPYAGWLYASFTLLGILQESAEFRVSNAFDLTFGVVGPSSLADDVQRRWHKIIDTRTPEGWDHQLHDEPGLNLTYTRVWERFVPLVQPWVELSLAPHVVGAAGNIYTYLGTGGMLRLGHNLRSDIGPPAISPAFPGTAYFRSDKTFSAYLFAGVEGRAVARNIFLDGNTFTDSHSVDTKPLVGDFQAGAAIRWRHARLSFTNVFRSKEFDGQQEPSEYGAINLTVLY
jgi:hypothetical protein